MEDKSKDSKTEPTTPPVTKSEVESVLSKHVETPAKMTFNLSKKKLMIIGGVVAVLVLALVGFLVFGKSDDDKQGSTFDASSYNFLSMAKCQSDLKNAGLSVGEANDTCMRLEKELSSKSASGSKDFEPAPLECETNVPDTQWYRIDNTFVIDPKNPDTMYLNVERKGVHKTTDGGKTWTMKVKGLVVDHKDVNSGKPCYGEYPVAIIDPGNTKRILLATSGGGGGTINDQNMRGGGVYESTDGAETWKQKITDKMNGYTTHALVFAPDNTQTFYYGTAASPASYTEADPNKIWVTKGLIYKATDNGKTWTELPTGFIKNTRLISIMIEPTDPQKITAATNVVLRNADGPNTISQEQMGIIQSTDGGNKWQRIDNLPTGHQAAQQTEMSPRNGSHMFHVSATNGGMKSKSFYSHDGGKTWNESSQALDVFAYDPSDASGNHMFGHIWQCYSSPSCAKKLYESNDGGKTWSTFGTLPADIKELGDKKTRIGAIVWHPSDKNTFFLTGAGANVWKTTDKGATWTNILNLDKLPK